MPSAWLLAFAVARLHDGDLHTAVWGWGPGALVTPLKAIRVGVGGYKKSFFRLPIKTVAMHFIACSRRIRWNLGVLCTFCSNNKTLHLIFILLKNSIPELRHLPHQH